MSTGAEAAHQTWHEPAAAAAAPTSQLPRQLSCCSSCDARQQPQLLLQRCGAAKGSNGCLLGLGTSCGQLLRPSCGPAPARRRTSVAVGKQPLLQDVGHGGARDAQRRRLGQAAEAVARCRGWLKGAQARVGGAQAAQAGKGRKTLVAQARGQGGARAPDRRRGPARHQPSVAGRRKAAGCSCVQFRAGGTAGACRRRRAAQMCSHPCPTLEQAPGPTCRRAGGQN